MASVRLRLGEVNPTDIRLYEVVDDTPKITRMIDIFLYSIIAPIKYFLGEPGLRLRQGEVSPSDIRLYESQDSRKQYQSVDIILRDASVPVGVPSVIYYGILRAWSGAAWLAKSLKVYITGWVAKAVRYWSGTEWLLIDT